MSTNPLDILKKGLGKLKNSFKAEKEQLGAKLSRQESISSSDGMSDGSTKETPLTSNIMMSLTPLSHPPTMSEGQKTWMKLERSSLKS